MISNALKRQQKPETHRRTQAATQTFKRIEE